ncbi:hypothetical protein OG984_00715 [Nocardioides sp. NBC_00368]|uniref:hypothetical protein n=1 Tax=Nocardioides sp. NBC_00368 TaxID=2976000 RepID=UPI002E20761C
MKSTPGLEFDHDAWERAESADGLIPKLDATAEIFGARCGPERDLVHIAIVWRNRVVHEGASNQVPQATRNRLSKSAEEIHKDYQGLDVERTVESLKRSTDRKVPSFKETTALVRAAQRFVENVDAAVLDTISPGRYLIDVLRGYVEQDVATRLSNVWGKGPDRTLASVLQVAQSAGMSRLDAGGIPIEAEVATLLRATPKEAKRVLGL